MDPAELDDVVEEEEVAGETEFVDHPELVVDLTHRPIVVGMGGRVVDGRTALCQLGEPAHVVVVVGHRVIGQVRYRDAKIERALLCDVDGALHRARIAGETTVLLGGAAQMGERCGR